MNCSVMKRSVLKSSVLAAVWALCGAGAANAHNDFTDRSEYFAATPQSPGYYYEPQFYYYPSYTQPLYTQPLYTGRSIYLAPRHRRR